MKEGWAKTLFLSKIIDRKFEDMSNRIDSVIRALTSITLSISGVGAELAGTTVSVSDGTETFTEVFNSNLRVSFQLEKLGTYTIKYKHSNTQEGEKQAIISDYGYHEVTVNYFPGYDLWNYWSDLAGVKSGNYPSITQMLNDDLAMLSLMSSVSAIEYMIASTGGIISAAVLNNSKAVKAMIRSPYAVQKMKQSSYWRRALLNNSDAVKACYEAKDTLKTSSVTARVNDVYNGNKHASKSDTKNVDIIDSDMILIACGYAVGCWSWDNGTTSDPHYAKASGKIIINGITAANKSVSAWKQAQYATASTGNIVLYNSIDSITNITVYVEATSFGANAFGTAAATFYYL